MQVVLVCRQALLGTSRGRDLPLRGRVLALVTMWGMVGVSLGTLALSERLQVWFAVALVIAAMVGTYFILTFRARPRVVAQVHPRPDRDPGADVRSTAAQGGAR